MDTTIRTPAVPHKKRTALIDNLLGKLEAVTTDALATLEARMFDAGSNSTVVEFLGARGKLIAQLVAELDGTVVTFVEWNRLVIVHKQGEQIEAHLRQVREQLAVRAAVSGRDRAFLDCVSGVFTQQASSGQNILA